MKSYLISTLVRRFKTSDLAEFKQAHGHDWLLWEPGKWRPAHGENTLGSGTPETPNAPRGSEALALALEPTPSGEPVTLGRGPECEVSLNDGTLTQRHLLFRRLADGSWTVEDTGSRNGSWLDGAKLEGAHALPLTSGGKIRAGEVNLTFYAPVAMYARLRELGGR